MALEKFINEYKKLTKTFYDHVSFGDEVGSNVFIRIKQMDKAVDGEVKKKAKKNKKMSASVVQRATALSGVASVASLVDEKAGDLYFDREKIKGFKGLIGAASELKIATAQYSALLSDVKNNAHLSDTQIQTDAKAASKDARQLEVDADTFYESLEF